MAPGHQRRRAFAAETIRRVEKCGNVLSFFLLFVRRMTLAHTHVRRRRISLSLTAKLNFHIRTIIDGWWWCQHLGVSDQQSVQKLWKSPKEILTITTRDGSQPGEEFLRAEVVGCIVIWNGEGKQGPRYSEASSLWPSASSTYCTVCYLFMRNFNDIIVIWSRSVLCFRRGNTVIIDRDETKVTVDVWNREIESNQQPRFAMSTFDGAKINFTKSYI